MGRRAAVRSLMARRVEFAFWAVVFVVFEVLWSCYVRQATACWSISRPMIVCEAVRRGDTRDCLNDRNFLFRGKAACVRAGDHVVVGVSSLWAESYSHDLPNGGCTWGAERE
jgi:hypothetical protein